MENKQDLQWNLIYQAAQEAKISTLFKLFRAEDIEPVLIKGLSVSRFFPPEVCRISMDIDLAVQTKDFQKSLKIAAKTKINVDLHKELRHLDSVSYSNLYDHSQSVTLDNGYQIRTLCAEDSLRVICVHWLNDGGIKKDRLWDIYYCVKNRPDNFDWERCLNVAGNTRRKWVLVSVKLAHHYFQLPINGLPFADEISKPNFVPKWIYETLEKEWSDEVILTPLNASFSSPKTLFRQIHKRFPPNAITATIQTNSNISNFPRLPIQIYNMVRRIFPVETSDQSLYNLFLNKFFKRK